MDSSDLDSKIKLWLVADGKEIQTLEGYVCTPGYMFFSMNGFYLITASTDGTIRVWGIMPE